jgi:HK97 family phage prohead protease
MNKTYIKAYIEKSADKKTYTFLASTSSVDRQGDSIDQSGWELENFKKNPVGLWAHKYDELPIAKIENIKVTEKGLEAEFIFAEHQKAQDIKNLVDTGVLNAVSVGFIGKERNGNVITRAELLEISIVPVPANQDAILLSKEISDTIKKDIEDVLCIPPDTEEDEDEEEEVVVEEKSGRVISTKNRKLLEATRDALKTSLSEIEKLLAEGVTTTEEDVKSDNSLVLVDRTLIEDLKFLLRSDNRTNDKILSSLKNI